ncbi:hypothetical protein ACFL6C_10635 [Myxococcota bacterium]
MTDADLGPSRDWIIAAGSRLYATVTQYSDRARDFCIEELGMQWDAERRDNTYFAEAMRKAREAKKDRLERLRALIPRREAWEPPGMSNDAVSSEANDFLATLLDDTRDIPTSTLALLHWASRQIELDLRTVEEHILTHLGMEETDIRDLPIVATDARVDLVFKFTAAIFLQHAGLVKISQPSVNTVFLARRASSPVLAAMP